MVTLNGSDDHAVFALFAGMLDYPCGETLESASECARILSESVPEAARLVKSFADFLATSPQGRIEEVYVSMFDMNVTHAPYLGYHLFGETYKRSSFMISLRERYSDSGFRYTGVEMPDHIAVLLQFLSLNNGPKVDESLVRDALLPALRKMVAAKPLKKSAYPARVKPYTDVENALLLVLEQRYGDRSPLEANAGGVIG